MVKVVGVRFRKACKVYDFSSGDQELKAGDAVVVEVERGLGMGVVASNPVEKDSAKLKHKLKKVIRKADQVDIERQNFNREREDEAFKLCREKIKELRLDMKLIRVEYLFDSSKAIFYFTSDERVDFRELVKVLASRFHTRIEMKQIGVRDEAKTVGGLGPCGRELCCTQFLSDFAPVTVKMAKEQNLALNPAKISGICGRLMCCLSYEHQDYLNERRKGVVATVVTRPPITFVEPDGEGAFAPVPGEEEDGAHGSCGGCGGHGGHEEHGDEVAEGATAGEAGEKGQEEEESKSPQDGGQGPSDRGDKGIRESNRDKRDWRPPQGAPETGLGNVGAGPGAGRRQGRGRARHRGGRGGSGQGGSAGTAGQGAPGGQRGQGGADRAGGQRGAGGQGGSGSPGGQRGPSGQGGAPGSPAGQSQGNNRGGPGRQGRQGRHRGRNRGGQNRPGGQGGQGGQGGSGGSGGQGGSGGSGSGSGQGGAQ